MYNDAIASFKGFNIPDYEETHSQPQGVAPGLTGFQLRNLCQGCSCAVTLALKRPHFTQPHDSGIPTSGYALHVNHDISSQSV